MLKHLVTFGAALVFAAGIAQAHDDHADKAKSRPEAKKKGAADKKDASAKAGEHKSDHAKKH
jgi:hypothetical protein